MIAEEILAGKVMPGFIDVCGHLQYADAISERHWRWRDAVLRAAVCEIPGCETGRHDVVLDHCHAHGWVRGVVCPSHNVRLGQIDAVRTIGGAVVDLAATPYAAHIENCPGCSGSPLREASAQPWSQDPREPWRPPSRTGLDYRVWRPPSTTSHLALTETRTWCGRNADGMTRMTANVRRVSACASCTDARGRALMGKPAPRPAKARTVIVRPALF